MDLQLLRLAIQLAVLTAVLYLLCSLVIEVMFGCDIDGLDDDSYEYDGIFEGADDAYEAWRDEQNGVRP